MQKSSINPDNFTYSIILHGLKINNLDPHVVRSSLYKIKKVVEAEEFRLDDVFFNSVLDVCCKYELLDELEVFI